MPVIKHLDDLQHPAIFCSILNIKGIKYSPCCPNALQIQTCDPEKARRCVRSKRWRYVEACNTAARPFLPIHNSSEFPVHITHLCCMITDKRISVCSHNPHLTKAEQTNIFIYPQSVDYLFKCQAVSHSQVPLCVRSGAC